jgi:cell division protein FtsW
VKRSIGHWFASIDRVSFFIVLALISIGVWTCFAATPAIALKLGLSSFHFIKQHLPIVPLGIITIIVISFFRVGHIRKIALCGYIICIVLLICVLMFGIEAKGAKRWIHLWFFTLQPSEFLKPTLVVTTAWLLAEQYIDRRFPGIMLAIACIMIVLPLLLLQPDVGMTIVIMTTWIGQLFVAGLSIGMIVLFVLSVILVFCGLYFAMPHFAERINDFLTGGGDAYQIGKSIEAFKSGGWFGKGIGEGIVKTLIPDAHSDFVFSVMGEEFGFLICLLVMGAYAFLIVRSLMRVINSSNIFDFVVVFGIVLQIGIQVLINVATTLNMIPTKGMTLPFISCGGSSFLSASISVGILLAITKSSKRTVGGILSS